LGVDFDVPEELLLLKRTVREFVEGRLQPIEKQVEDCLLYTSPSPRD